MFYLEHILHFHQGDDGDGMLNTSVYGGKVKLIYPSTKNDSDMQNVAFSSNITISRYVHIYKRDGIQKFYDYEFANAYVLFYKERFTANGSSPLITQIVISPEIIKRDNSIFQTYWNPSNPFKNQIPVTVRETYETKLLGYHIENLKNNIIKENSIIKNQLYLNDLKCKPFYGSNTSK